MNRVHTHIRSLTKALLLGAVAAAGVSALAGCRGDRSDNPPFEFFPGMDDQPRYKAQSQSTFFKDGRTMREPVEGTVPFGRHQHVGTIVGQERNYVEGDQRPALVDVTFNFDEMRSSVAQLDARVTTGKNADGSFVEFMPIEVTPQLIAIGKTQYQINCIHCHGGTGNGGDDSGMVGKLFSIVPANLHQERLQPGGDNGQDGHIYDIIQNGKLNPPGSPLPYNMPPLGYKMTDEQVWSIVAYVRTLQTTRTGTLGDVPQADRDRLIRERNTPADPAAAMSDATQAVTDTMEVAQ